MRDKYKWLLYVALAGLAWGTYVPIIFYGGNELGGKSNARLMAILCVGLAYFVIGVLFPLAMFLSGRFAWPQLKKTGLVFSCLAGVAGAVGAIGVVFATQAARAAAPAGSPDRYRVFIAPLIFGLAPVINTLVSMVWHPRPGHWNHFGFKPPHWLLWLGIVLVGIGAGLVLYSKELTEEPASAPGATSATRGEPRPEAATRPGPAEAAVPAGPSTPSSPRSEPASPYLWLLYVALAGLAWGTYVPIIFYGGNELGGKPNARLMAILCVGLAYFVIGVLFPLILFLTGQYAWPRSSPSGLSFSGLAGVAGAVGAICVIFATQAARAAAPPDSPDRYRVFIAPLIFGLAPIINTLVSIVWAPAGADWFRFHLHPPHWLLWLGILCVAVGAGLVLYSKELAETSGGRPATPAAPPPDRTPGSPGVPGAAP